jgi:hypothetical protein
MKLKIALDEKKLDKRLTDRLIGEKKLTQKELDEHLMSLPDNADKADLVELDANK